MQALCGLQGIFDLFNCKTPVLPLLTSDTGAGKFRNNRKFKNSLDNSYNPVFDS